VGERQTSPGPSHVEISEGCQAGRWSPPEARLTRTVAGASLLPAEVNLDGNVHAYIQDFEKIAGDRD
jgi:hypothetical protein